MNGDLGNLLTGEMGEAESRFAHDDFAEAYGRRVAGRVRRRRAVRAAGVGGGTMLTAGALVVGATHMPWGALGAASGVGGSDCVTPSPSVGAPTYSVTIDTDQGSLANFDIMYPATGETILNGARQTDGTYLFTDGHDDPLSAVPGSAGFYSVELPSGVTSLEATTTLAYRSSTVETNYLRVHVPELVMVSTDLTRRATGDCYTPSPTPSPTPSIAPSLSLDTVLMPDPSLAAKPDNVIGDSPFECGFEFPTESGGTEDLWIDGLTSVDGPAVEAAIRSGFADPAAVSIVTPVGPVPVVSVHFAVAADKGGLRAMLGTNDPSIGTIKTDLAGTTTDTLASEGATFVGTVNGRVVAKLAMPAEGSATAAPIFTDWRAPGDASLMYLLDQGAALTSCDANPVDFSSIDLFAVAGLVVMHSDGAVNGPTYAWLPVGKP